MPDGFSMIALTAVGRAILGSSGRWFYWAMSEPLKKTIKRCLPEQSHSKAVCYVFLTSLVLQCLGLGKAACTVYTSGGGRRNWFFLKRPVDASMHEVLAIFGYTIDSTPSLQSYADSVTQCALLPPRAPSHVDQVFLAGLRGEGLTEAMRLLGAAPPELAAVEEAADALGEELAAPDAAMAVDDGGYGL
jgi:hypothetical protein